MIVLIAIAVVATGTGAYYATRSLKNTSQANNPENKEPVRIGSVEEMDVELTKIFGETRSQLSPSLVSKLESITESEEKEEKEEEEEEEEEEELEEETNSENAKPEVCSTHVTNATEDGILQAYFAKKEFKESEECSDVKGVYKVGNTFSIDTPKELDDISAKIKDKINADILDQKAYVKLETVKAKLESLKTELNNEFLGGSEISVQTYKIIPDFVKIESASLESDVYVFAKTGNLDEKEITITIHEKEQLLVNVDSSLPVLKLDKNSEEKQKTEDLDEITELKDTIEKGMVAIPIRLRPKTEENYLEWKDKLEGKKDKDGKEITPPETTIKEFLWLKATCQGHEEMHEKEFLNEDEDSYFELGKGCDCGKKYDKEFNCTRFGKQYGPVYWGSEKLEDYDKWAELISNNKITQFEKDIMVGMSPNEGNLDAVQSYDSEILTAGAMQKTVNPSGQGEFPIQVQGFKDEYPAKYDCLFVKCGWTVESNTMYYKNPDDANATKVTGSSLKTLVRDGFTAGEFGSKLKCKPLEPIVNAVKDKDFQAKQIEDFIDRLRNKVLPITPVGYSYSLENYLISKLGRATALDHHINRPAYVDNDFGDALDNFFTKKDAEINKFNLNKPQSEHKSLISKNPGDWGANHSAYEQEILDDYGVNRRGTDMPNRYAKMKARL